MQMPQKQKGKILQIWGKVMLDLQNDKEIF